jgi:hypothetical protein
MSVVVLTYFIKVSKAGVGKDLILLISQLKDEEKRRAVKK